MKASKTFQRLRLKDKLMGLLQKKGKQVRKPNHGLKEKGKLLTLSGVQGPQPSKVSRSKALVFSLKASRESSH